MLNTGRKLKGRATSGRIVPHPLIRSSRRMSATKMKGGEAVSVGWEAVQSTTELCDLGSNIRRDER